MRELDFEELVNDIRKKGYIISHYNEIDQILNSKTKKDLVPILISHLKKTDYELHKQFLVRRLGVKGFIEVTEYLLKEFKKPKSGLSYRWAIGNSLSLILDKKYENDYIEIIQNKEYGTARKMIVITLGKIRSQRAISVLLDLLNDEDIDGHIIVALGYYKDSNLIQYIEPFLKHENRWIRKEAEKSIKKLSKYKK